MAADWELTHPDMLIWIRQAASRDSSPYRTTRPRAEYTPPDAPQCIILSLRADNLANTEIGEEYAILGREFGLPWNFELLPTSDKLEALNARHIEPTRILRFLDLVAKRYTARAFAGLLRPAASGTQSYLGFCTFGLFSPYTVSWAAFWGLPK